MNPAAQVVWSEGGYATRGQVVAAVGRSQFDKAVEDGSIVWVSWGRYGLPGLDKDVLVAHGANGVLSHTSAARWHGWELKTPSATVHVTVPQRRRLAPAHGLVPHFVDLRPEDIEDDIATSWRRTLVDCTRTLPPDEGLTVCDSALRRGVPRAMLDDIARTVRGRGRPAVVRATSNADLRGANPFESCLRSIALDVPGLSVVPQVVVSGAEGRPRPDLVDEQLKVIVEAESFAWHGDRSALRRDARRYNLLVVDGWLVLRFSWEDVMFDPGYVRDVLTAIANTRSQVLRCPTCNRAKRAS